MNQRGFTFTEILIVLGVLLLFSTFFVVVINPIHRIQEARDDTREAHLNTILLGIEQKLSREGGWNCASLPTDRFREIGTGPGMYDLYSCLTPNYLSKYLVDPKEGNPSSGRDVTDGLVGHWKFDEGSGTIAYDASGNGNDGTLVDGPNWVDGKIGGALDFDGSSNYVDCGNNASLSAPSKLTVEAFFKPNTVSPLRQQIVGKQNFLNEYRIILYENDIVSQIYDTTHEYSVRSSNGGVYAEAGVWYHAVMTYDGANLKLYINGTLVDTLSLAITINPNYLPLNIGRNNSNVFYFNGQIDDVRIYNRALSPEEIQDLYNYEYSSKYAIWQNPVTKNISLKSLESETKEVSTGAPEVALDFDGSGDYVDCGNDESLDFGPGDFTASLWFKANIMAGMMVGTQINSGNYQGWYLGSYYGNDLHFEVKDVDNRRTIANFEFTDTQSWHHLVGAREGSLLTVYLDGVNKINASGAGNIPFLDKLLIGARPSPVSSFFNGQISDVRIYNRALSAEEIEQLYKGYDIRNGLVGHWPLNEGQGTIAYDRSGNGNNGTLLPAIDGPTWTTK